MATPDMSQQAFEAAKEKFRKSLKSTSLHRDLLRTTSIDELWKTVKAVQNRQNAQKVLQNMERIGGFLRKLHDYHKVIGTFVQVKPDAMALIWGPIQLLLVWTANTVKFGDAVLSAMTRIADALPHFADMGETFPGNERLKSAMVDFYCDILDFHTITLDFFSRSRSSKLFEAVWPKLGAKIDIVAANIRQHVEQMRNEVAVQHIKEASSARVKPLAQFDQENEFQELQRFQALRINLSPRMYDDDLDWFLNRACPGSDKWLLAHQSFQEWLEGESIPAATPRIWLRGMPGAGKTFLCAAAVREARRRCRSLFIFASHRVSSTARSILLSLLFQLALDERYVRSVLVELDERNLRSSMDYVSEHLTELLDGAGPTYIIIDGLDEVDPVERRILLHQLAKLEKCPEVKVMVGSRPEDDIARILDSTFAPIRVDKNNLGSIQLYVNQRTRDWIESVGFDEDARDQLQHLLAPIAPNANGMFLYARVVLDNTVQLTDFDEIERELKTLPTDLNDAYQRIFSRINQSPPALRNKARKILGWIGCSPVPMTRLEMEQMLQIEPSCSGTKAAPRVQAELNFSALCGPLVEMVEDCPQFVHFTVKEYIFSQEISNHLEKKEAEYMLAKSSLAYLCSPVLELSASNDEIREAILHGRYRLHYFVSSQWLAIAGRILSWPLRVSRDREFVDLLVRLTLERKNYGYKEDSETKSLGVQASTAAAASVSDLHTTWPEVMQMIGQATGFLRDDRHAEWNYTNSSTWMNFDPTTISSMSVRIHTLLEDMICDNPYGKHSKQCHCGVLGRHYGPRIFKCAYPSCDHSRHGFSGRSIRNAHVSHHSRPWKCSLESCPFAIIGFARKRDSESHWQQRHLAKRASAPPASPNLAGLSAGEYKALAYELTKLGKLDELQHVVLYMAQRFNTSFLLLPARLLAAEIGSLLVLELLEQFDGDWIDYYFGTPFPVAVFRGRSTEVLRWMITKLCRLKEKYRHYGALAATAFGTDSPDMYTVWEEFLLNNTDRLTEKEYPYSQYSESQFIPAENLIPLASKRSVLFSENAFCAVRKNVIHQIRLVQTWHRFIDKVLLGHLPHPRFLGWSLTRLAMSAGPSVELAAELLRLGAPIDFPRGSAGAVADNTDIARIATAMTLAACNSSSDSEDTRSARRRRQLSRNRGKTALHHASMRATEQSARFMRFLLEQGADPNYAFAGEEPAQQPGARAMESFLGESWEQVVERTLPARLARKEQEGHLDVDDGDEDELEQDEATRTKRRRK